MAAMGCLLLDVTAYADTGPFNPIYSGRLSFTTKVYMTISSSDAVMTKVIYPLSAETDRFLTIYNADTVDFTRSVFHIYYSHNGEITTLEGDFVQYVPAPVIIQAESVDLTFGLFGNIKDVTVTYNGREYKKA